MKRKLIFVTLLCSSCLCLGCHSHEPGPAERIGRGLDEIAKGMGGWSSQDSERAAIRREEERRRLEEERAREGSDYYRRDDPYDRGSDGYYGDEYGDSYGSDRPADARTDYHRRERY